MRHFLKRTFEHTRLAAVFRAAREEWRFAGLKFERTPFGYLFAGSKSMQAGTFEVAEVSVVKQHLRSVDVFVDVGANVGYFACLACSMGSHVVAIEPFWGNLRYLYANLQANGWAEGVEVYPVGLSDAPGLATLYGAGTAASLVPGWAGASDAFKRTIPVASLDALLGDRLKQRKLLIKMDIEGNEYNALLGAYETLRATPRPIWMVEITLSEHRQGERNADFLRTFELFWDLGYTATAVGPHTRQVSCSEVTEYTQTGTRPDWASGNYLFTAEVE